jgi:hypothetical protein
MPGDESILTVVGTTGGIGLGFEGSRLGKGIPCRSYTKGWSRIATIQASQNNPRCAVRLRLGPTVVSCVRKLYLE